MLNKKINKESAIRIRVLEQDKDLIKKAAKHLGVSMSELILNAVDEYLSTHCKDLKN